MGADINGAQLAKKLGITPATGCRWVKAGKLPQPERSVSGMMLFRRETTEA